MDPRLRGDDRGVAVGGFFYAEGYLCVFVVAGVDGLLGSQAEADKICQFGPIFGPVLSIMVRCEEKHLQACGPCHCTLV
jgi:hypothetical protein